MLHGKTHSSRRRLVPNAVAWTQRAHGAVRPDSALEETVLSSALKSGLLAIRRFYVCLPIVTPNGQDAIASLSGLYPTMELAEIEAREWRKTYSGACINSGVAVYDPAKPAELDKFNQLVAEAKRATQKGN